MRQIPVGFAWPNREREVASLDRCCRVDSAAVRCRVLDRLVDAEHGRGGRWRGCRCEGLGYLGVDDYRIGGGRTRRSCVARVVKCAAGVLRSGDDNSGDYSQQAAGRRKPLRRAAGACGHVLSLVSAVPALTTLGELGSATRLRDDAAAVIRSTTCSGQVAAQHRLGDAGSCRILTHDRGGLRSLHR